MDSKEFGKRLKALRLKHELTLKELGEMIELSPKTISQIETGRTSTTLKTLVKICNTFEISPEYFLSKDLKASVKIDQKDRERRQEELYKHIMELPEGEREKIADYVKMYLENEDKYK
jgi:Predicted transcriptional regulators